VHQNIDYQLKEPTRVTSLARSFACLGNTVVSKFLLVPINKRLNRLLLLE